ncbi:hypothetical protein ACHAW5_005967 [Stephanodiscus triporus]|uniref:Oxidation resistance protein 1 n=1 Tax=Stephanodiscus triporus TaxID=2934178 RepID=A0ABD3MCC9_9STRA
MGASSSRETQLANERAYIHSLGDRYPLSDAELRKWCWCHERLCSSAVPPVASTSLHSIISLLSIWSAVYGDYNPYSRHTSSSNTARNPLTCRVNAANQLLEAITNVEKYIFPAGFTSRIERCALGLSLKSKSNSKGFQSTDYDPIRSSISLTSIEEMTAFEESYYSIASSVNEYVSSGKKSSYDNRTQSQSLECFLDGISASCGRRGSRSSLSKIFAIASSCDESIEASNLLFQPGRSAKAEASMIIHTAYCLALAASYLKGVAAQIRNGGEVSVQEFIPREDPKNRQAMVDSLISSAKNRQDEEGLGGNFGFVCPSSTATNGADSVAGEYETVISLEEFLEWAETEVPMMGSALPTFLHVLFAFFSPAGLDDDKDPSFPPGVTPLWIPHLTIDRTSLSMYSSPSSTFFPAPASSSFDLFALSCTSLTLASGRWHRLFSSEANGLSSNRLMHSILGYGGPTIILIRSKDTSDEGNCISGVFGAYTFTPWTQESPQFYGDSDCFLFRLGPDPMAIYRPKGGGEDGMDTFGMNKAVNLESSRNYMYFNSEARSKGYDGLSHGIGFGGTCELPRLFIDEVLDACRAAPEDMTYGKGPLLSGLKDFSATSHFEVEAMEAWGVGTSQLVEEALLARDGQRQDALKKIRTAMKGAKGQFLEDFQSGLAGNKLYQHREQIQGREGDCNIDRVNEEKI